MEQNRRLVLLLIFAVAVAVSYYFLSPNEKAPAPRPSAPAMDSTATSQRPVITAPTDTVDTLPPAAEKLAPGTALIRATILTASDNQRAMTIRVDEVMGYGSSTPPLPSGTELSVDMQNFLQQHPDLRDHLSKGATVTLIVAAQQGMGSDGTPSWTLVEFKP